MQYLAIYLLVQPSVTMVTVETQTWTRPSRLTHPACPPTKVYCPQFILANTYNGKIFAWPLLTKTTSRQVFFNAFCTCL